jgi:hypothetical protein
MANLRVNLTDGGLLMSLKSLLVVLVLTCALALTCAPTSSAVANESIYTDLLSNKCKTISVDQESGASTQLCPGVAGYKLEVHDDDARMSVTVIKPNGRKYPLEYWNVITSGFSSVGEKAEWRVVRQNGKVVPVALIVRVNTNENSEVPEQKTSYLAVAKITAQGICVTDKIGPGATMNEDARRAADASANKPCLK